MRIPPQLGHEFHIRVRTDGTLTAWSPLRMEHVALEPAEVTALCALGSGATAAQAMRRAGLEPRDEAEAEAWFERFVALGFLEDPTDRPPHALIRAVSGLVGVAATAATAAIGTVRSVRRGRTAFDVPPSASLDLAWDAPPAWRASTTPRTVVRRPERGAPVRDATPVSVSVTAYPLS